ncbi:MAG: class I SAM-dependent RNA methyltransferase [Bryobacterales bacterium]|nr:class I SAM-dependent RNA methyltransferase [Bryobacterales bacterium]
MNELTFDQPQTPETEPSAMLSGRVEKLIFGGAGLIRHEGKTVMLPGVAPGELVQFTTAREHKQWAEGKLVAVDEPSSERVEPFCPVFDRCGGCQYQHLNDEFQRQQKVAILLETLERVGGIRLELPVEILAGEARAYRNRIQVHLDGTRIGYRSQSSRRLVPIEECPIASPRLNEAIHALKQMAREPRFPRFVESIELFSNERKTLLNVTETKGGQRRVARWFIDWCAERIPGSGQSALVYKAAGLDFQVGHRSFFQTNRFLIDVLVERVLRHAKGTKALDLYSGVGLFAIPLSKRGISTTAVESSASAVRDLEANAANHSARVDAIKASVDTYLSAADTVAEMVIADPPRAGLGKTVVQDLLRLRPKQLCIVSCDPATLARDLSSLVGGGYRLTDVSLVDLFPNTAHIETVCDLALTI